ncbi:hypothetical protein TNCV_1564671 [Trichonephila clavipes]|nr:hypothetical protein TNCV_1564671 [Trichonephila clavipes]
MTFVKELKSFFKCPCSLPDSLAHLLDCWGISLGQLFGDQHLVCDILMRKGQMDGVDFSAPSGFETTTTALFHLFIQWAKFM